MVLGLSGQVAKLQLISGNQIISKTLDIPEDNGAVDSGSPIVRTPSKQRPSFVSVFPVGKVHLAGLCFQDRAMSA